jgi:MFS family permease
MAVEKPSTIHCESPSADISGNEAQTTYSQLGREYYLSMQFIGSYLAAGVAFGYSLCAFNLIAPIMVQINQDIGPDPNYVWLSYIYTTTLAILSPIVGRLTDIFGRRYIFIALTLVGIVGLSVCATAQSIPVLIGGQVLVSISSTVGYSVVYIIGELVPVRYRYTFYAMIFIFAVPSTVGPAIAETLVHNYPGTTWRGVYYILIAMNVLSLVCWILFYFPPDFEMKHQTRKRRAFIANFDYIGLLLFAGGLVVLLFGLSCGGTIYAWKSAATICMIVAGFLTLVAFVLWERFAARAEPVIPWQIFRRRDFVATLTAVGFATSVFFSTAIIWPRQVTLLYSEGGYMRTGFLSSLPGLAQLAGQFIGGGISLPIGHHKFQLVAYFCISGTLYACLQTHSFSLASQRIKKKKANSA